MGKAGGEERKREGGNRDDVEVGVNDGAEREGGGF